MSHVTGVKELERTIKRLTTTGSSRVARAAMTGLAQPLRAGLRRQVNSNTKATDKLKKNARETIGSAVYRLDGNNWGMHYGFGAGKQSKGKRLKAMVRAAEGQGGTAAFVAGGAKKRSGVGIGQRNIHWLVFGTGERNVKVNKPVRRHKSGKETGSTTAYFYEDLPIAFHASLPAAKAKAVSKSKVALAKEATKRR